MGTLKYSIQVHDGEGLDVGATKRKFGLPEQDFQYVYMKKKQRISKVA